jgi:methionyl-tRNA formyltransferase
MNACEWSVLFGLEPTVTIHWIDAGIDTGPTIAQATVPVCPTDDLASLRERATVTGVEALCRHVTALADTAPAARPNGPLSRQCYVLAPALRELAEAKLRRSYAAMGNA